MNRPTMAESARSVLEANTHPWRTSSSSPTTATMWWTVGDNGASVDIRTSDGMLNVPVDPAVIKRDPDAGSRWSRSSISYSSLEVFPAGNWREINRHFEPALDRPASGFWTDE